MDLGLTYHFPFSPVSFFKEALTKFYDKLGRSRCSTCGRLFVLPPESKDRSDLKKLYSSYSHQVYLSSGWRVHVSHHFSSLDAPIFTSIQMGVYLEPQFRLLCHNEKA